MPLAGDLDYLQAKVHGLRSRLYEGDRLDALCDLRSLPQLWHRLYPEAEPAGHHELQRRLLADHVHTLDLLRLNVPDALTDLVTWLLRRFQLENLKVLLRARRVREPLERVEPFLAPLPDDLALPARALLRAESLADFLLLVPVPELRKGGERGAAPHVETGEPFFIELALESAYYEGLLARQRRLPLRHRRATQPLLRLEAVVHTLLGLFRLKLNYAVPYETARPFFVPGTLDPFRLERLYGYPAFEDMLRLVPREFVPPEQYPATQGIADLERVLWQRLLAVANRQFYRSTDDLGVVVAFFTIKRVEMANLIRVVEGVRYGLEPAMIRRGLIRVQYPE
jgi:vacuolar-type H+-ATPase subunit C/Vma6